MLPQIITAAAGAAAQGFTGPVGQAATYGANALALMQIPAFDETVNCWLTGEINTNRLRDNAQLNGIYLGELPIEVTKYITLNPQGVADYSPAFNNAQMTIWGRMLRNRTYMPTIDEAIVMWNRELITEPLFDYFVERQCNNQPEWKTVWHNMRYEIPGPSDLIRFAVREAYNPELLSLYGYAQETPQEVKPWMDKQGYGQDTGIPFPANATDGDNNPLRGNATWFDLYWWSHWELPSLTQGYDMLHRLYITSDYGRSPDVIGDASFMQRDMELLQKAQDIPAYWRQRLQAISYHPLNRTDADWMYENSLIQDAEYYHAMRQGGYNDATSKQLLQRAKLVRARSMRADPVKVTKDWICNNYKTGILTDDRATALLMNNGYDAEDSRLFLQNCKIEIQAETHRQQLSHLQSAYNQGIFSDDELNQQFALLNMNQWVSEELTKRWKLKRAIKVKLASARQNLLYFKGGLINEPIVASRLFNLGFEATSIGLMIANAKREVMIQQSLKMAKEAKILAQQQKAAAKALADLAKKKLRDQQKQAKIVTNIANKRLRGFIKAATDANIVAWYNGKLLSLWEVYYRLYYKDFTLSDAERWVQTKFPDTKEDERNGASKKAQSQYRSEGNPPLI